MFSSFHFRHYLSVLLKVLSINFLVLVMISLIIAHKIFQNKWSSSVLHHLSSASILYGCCILICVALSGIYCLLRNLVCCQKFTSHHTHTVVGWPYGWAMENLVCSWIVIVLYLMVFVFMIFFLYCRCWLLCCCCCYCIVSIDCYVGADVFRFSTLIHTHQWIRVSIWEPNPQPQAGKVKKYSPAVDGERSQGSKINWRHTPWQWKTHAIWNEGAKVHSPCGDRTNDLGLSQVKEQKYTLSMWGSNPRPQD